MATLVKKLLSFLKYLWVLIPMAVHGAVTVLAVVVYCRFVPSSTSQYTAAASAMDAALTHVAADLRPLLDAHRSAFAVADALQLAAGNPSSFPQVGPKLFLAFVMHPLVSEMTFAGVDGAVYSYYRGEDALVRALFTSPRGGWYTQAADPATGVLVGRPAAAARPEHLPNATQVLVDYANSGGGRARASLGAGIRSGPDVRMLAFAAPVGDAGVVSAAVAVDDVLRGAAGSMNVDVQVYYEIDGGGGGEGHAVPTSYKALVGYDMEKVTGAFANVECTASAMDRAPELQLHSAMSGSYKVACTNFDVFGVNLRLRLATEVLDATTMFFRRAGVAVICVVLSMVVLSMAACFFMARALRRAAAREAALNAELLRLKEALQQAERKSMNKSNAFARASHDIRSSLAAIAGLIVVSRPDAQSIPTVTENLNQMDICNNKLFDILNTILDTSKVESGKMQLEEVEFNMADVLEESVDMANAAVIGRGGAVEVFWDPWDLSVLRCGAVIGDCKRFKQILDNLLGNAIKFTAEGHVVIRACCNLPIASRSSMAAPPSRFPGGGFLRRWLLRAREDRADQSSSRGGGAAGSPQNDPAADSVEFYFEVSDTGVGIPWEKRESVFENYVQVKEGHGGTGLGLGIVQSFVRLMGGEIGIMDKEAGEQGTCFRFNVLMKLKQQQQDEDGGDAAADIEAGTTSKTRDDGGDLRASLFREPGCFKGAQCVLLAHGDGTWRRILQGWMESVGMKVCLVHRADLIASTLEMVHSAGGSSASSPATLQPGGADCPGRDRCFSSKEMVSQVLPVSALRNGSGGGGGSGWQQHYPPLVIIDVSGAFLDDICKEVSSIATTKRAAPCKVICLADLRTFSEHSARLMAAGSDLVLRKPMHGSRLQALLRAMREPGAGSVNSAVPDVKDEAAVEVAPPPPPPQGPKTTAAGDDKPLDGMRVLLVEDTMVLQTIQNRMLTLLGANVKIAKDGSIAVDMFRHALEHAGAAAELPFDVIFMDCQMPVMNGYEATKLIREEEKRHGIRTPIIALTANSMEEDLKETIVAGMDLHLTKPIEKKRIVEAVHQICEQN